MGLEEFGYSHDIAGEDNLTDLSTPKWKIAVKLGAEITMPEVTQTC
jgi:hypothetical protein